MIFVRRVLIFSEQKTQDLWFCTSLGAGLGGGKWVVGVPWRSLVFPGRSLVFPWLSLVFPEGAPSNTREIRREKHLFNENDTFGNCLIDLLSILNELN